MRRRDEGTGIATGGGDERPARFRAVVEGLHRFARELQSATHAAANTQRRPTGPRGGIGRRAQGHGDSDEDSLQAMADAVAAAAAARRRRNTGSQVRGSPAVGAGDGDGVSSAMRATQASLAAAIPRRSFSRAGSVSVRGGGGVSRMQVDWHERIPSAPSSGRAPAYPQKPERGPFSLPSAANQRDAPRSLVEWFMTKVYDPVKVNERAEKLAARREQQRQLGQQAAEGEPAPSSEATESSAGVESEECSALVAGRSVMMPRAVTSPDTGTATSEWAWPSCSSAVQDSSSERPDSGVLVRSPSSTHSLLTPTPTQQSEGWQYGDSDNYMMTTESGLEMEEAEPPWTTPRQMAFAAAPAAAEQPQSALMRNRAHVLGSSLQLGSVAVAPCFHPPAPPPVIEHTYVVSSSTSLASLSAASYAAPTHHETTPAGGGGGLEPSASAASVAASASAVMMSASDEAAMERRRIRLKMMGGGGRPDWLNFDGETREWSGYYSSSARVQPQAQIPTSPYTTGYSQVQSVEMPMAAAGATPLATALAPATSQYVEPSAPLCDVISPRIPSPATTMMSSSHSQLIDKEWEAASVTSSTWAVTSCASAGEEVDLERRPKTPLGAQEAVVGAGAGGGAGATTPPEDKSFNGSSSTSCASNDKPKRQRRRRKQRLRNTLLTEVDGGARTKDVPSKHPSRPSSAKTTVLRRAKTTILPGASTHRPRDAPKGVRSSQLVQQLRTLRLENEAVGARHLGARRASSGALPLSLTLGRVLASASGAQSDVSSIASSPVARMISAATNRPAALLPPSAIALQSLSPRSAVLSGRRRGGGGGGGGGGLSGSEPRPLTREATFSLPDSSDDTARCGRRS